MVTPTQGWLAAREIQGSSCAQTFQAFEDTKLKSAQEWRPRQLMAGAAQDTMRGVALGTPPGSEAAREGEYVLDANRGNHRRFARCIVDRVERIVRVGAPFKKAKSRKRKWEWFGPRDPLIRP